MIIIMNMMILITYDDEDDDDDLVTQERMKRQMEALQERVSGAPSDIGDIRFQSIFRSLKCWNLTKPGQGSNGGSGEGCKQKGNNPPQPHTPPPPTLPIVVTTALT